jgi:hypothetical protein
VLVNNKGPVIWNVVGTDADQVAIMGFRVKDWNSFDLSEEDRQRNLREVASLLNLQNAKIESQAEELSEAKKLIKSLSEDLTQFSAFEQICNSGLLRNLKVDGESDFAQTLLGLLQSTLELQVSHLKAKQRPDKHQASPKLDQQEPVDQPAG